MKCYREDRDCQKECALYMPKVNKCAFAMNAITLVAILKILKRLEESVDAYLYEDKHYSQQELEEAYLG